MIQRSTPKKVRLRRTMMFMNAQKPSLIKDAYIYGADSIILDLEDAVAENQKDAARFSLFQALKTLTMVRQKLSFVLMVSIHHIGKRIFVVLLLAVLMAFVLRNVKVPMMFTL